MKKMAAIGGVALTVMAVSLALVGCGSNNKSASSSSSSASSGSTTGTSPAKPAAAPGPNPTIASYVQQSGIVETIVHKGDPGPSISGPIVGPMLDGWDTAGDDTPDWAYSAIIYKGPEAEQAGYVPNIAASMSKLTGDVDPQKIMEFAPGELNNLPGFNPIDKGAVGQLSGFPAYQISGTWVKDGHTQVIAQETVTIPAADGLYVFQLNAHGVDGQQHILADAVKTIDAQTRITT